MIRLWKRLSPFIMLGALVGSISWFSFVRLYTWSGASSLAAFMFGVFYIFWMLFEARVTLSDSRETDTKADKWSAEYYGISHGVTAIAAFAVEPYWFGSQPVWMSIGSICFIGAVGIRVWAVVSLGTMYSHRVRVRHKHKIVNTGPYKWIRHPAYTGMLGAHVALCIAFPSIPACTALLLLLFPAVITRILVEEKALSELSEYKEFAEHRKRLLPGVW
jgi:protein-S-isoprenylcysteine O-methyltransferase Ste14